MNIEKNLKYNIYTLVFFLFMVALTLSCKQKKVELIKNVYNEPNIPAEIIIDYNELNYRRVVQWIYNEQRNSYEIIIRSPRVRITDFVSSPRTIKINESLKLGRYPFDNIKLLQIDKEENKCLIKYEGSSDKYMTNPQWFKKSEAIFPSIFGEIGVTIHDIKEKEISVVLFSGGIITVEERED